MVIKTCPECVFVSVLCSITNAFCRPQLQFSSNVWRAIKNKQFDAVDTDEVSGSRVHNIVK